MLSLLVPRHNKLDDVHEPRVEREEERGERDSDAPSLLISAILPAALDVFSVTLALYPSLCFLPALLP